MKNLTDRDVIVQRENGTRFILVAAKGVPVLRHIPGTIMGVLNGVLIQGEDVSYVDFSDVELEAGSQGPYIVERNIFDALPASATDYITPDLGSSAVRNAYKNVQAVTRFCAKSKTPIAVFPTALELPITNNQ
jgi:hypothetical protein